MIQFIHLLLKHSSNQQNQKMWRVVLHKSSHSFGKKSSGVTKTLWDVYQDKNIPVPTDVMTKEEFDRKTNDKYSIHPLGYRCLTTTDRSSISQCKRILETFNKLRKAHEKLASTKSKAFETAENFEISCKVQSRGNGAITKKTVPRDLAIAMIGNLKPDQNGEIALNNAKLSAVYGNPNLQESFKKALEEHELECSKVDYCNTSFEYAVAVNELTFGGSDSDSYDSDSDSD